MSRYRFMQMEVWLAVLLPVLVAGGSALVSYYIMQSKLEVVLAQQRESLTAARATIENQKATLEDRIRASEESVRRVAFDEFMQAIQVEERSFVRDSSNQAWSKKKMVIQERLCFRNMPLSKWTEREILLEETRVKQLPERAARPFGTKLVVASAGGRPDYRKPRYRKPAYGKAGYGKTGYRKTGHHQPEQQKLRESNGTTLTNATLIDVTLSRGAVNSGR